MTNIWKRSLSMFLAFVMVFGMIPVNAFAVEEELVEEVLVEELVEEEIVEEEILEEEVFEEEVFEEEETEEEPAEVTVEEYHAADELANEVAAEGTIWVNKAKMEDEIFDILKEDGKIKTLILDSVFGEGNYDSTYTVEYACTYEGVDIVVEADDEHFAEKCGIALSKNVENSDDNSAIFLVNGVETKIIFKDSRYGARFEYGADSIGNKGPMTQAAVEALIMKDLCVTGVSPVDGDEYVAVLGTDYTVTFTYFDDNGDEAAFCWPEAQNTKDVKVVVNVTNDLLFDLDNPVWDEAWFTLEDTRELYTIRYATYYKYEDAEDAVVVKTFENVVEGDEIPAFTPADQEYYTLGDWSPVDDDGKADKDVTFTAVWSPKLDEDKDKVADQEEEYMILFQGGQIQSITKIHTGVAWGTQILGNPDIVPNTDNIDPVYNFKGWTPALPETVTAPANGSNMLMFTAQWTNNFVVKFLDPQGIEDQGLAAEVEDGSVIADPDAAQRWNGYYVKGWKNAATGEAYDFTKPVKSNLTLEPIFFVDRNNNKDEDGTAEDAFSYYVWMVGGNQVQKKDWLAGETEITVADFTYQEVAGDKKTFVKWDTAVSGDTTTYTAVFAEDTNNNEVDDTKETVNVTIEGVGTVTIDGTKVTNGAYVYDSTKSVNTVKAAPKMNGAYTATYAAAIELDGVAQELFFSNYAASAALKGAKTVKVVFVNCGFDVIAGAEMAPHAGAYTFEEVYNAVVTAPAFKNGTVVEYLAREAETIAVDISFVKDIVYGKTQDAATREMFDELYNEKTNGTGVYNLSYTAMWEKVNVVLPAEDTLDDCIARWTAWMEQEDVSLVDIKNNFNTMLDELEATNIHPFGKSADGTETLKITYKDAQINVKADASVTMVDNRVQTYIEVASTKTVTYGQIDVNSLTNNAYVVDGSGNRVSGATIVVKDAASFVDKAAGKYTVTLTVADFGDYIGNTATYELTVNKAPSKITLPEQIVVKKGDTFNAEPSTDAEFIHVMAGVDINAAKINLESGKIVEELTAKAWIKMPERILDMIDEVNANPDIEIKVELKDGKYTLDALQKMLAEDYAEAFNLAGIPKSAIDGIVEKLEKIRKLTGATDKLNLPNPVVDVVFVDSPSDSQGPEEIGMYINMGVIIDSNYTADQAMGILMIHPGAALPNKGIQLVYNNAAENLFESYANGKAVALNVQFEGKIVDCPVQYYGISNYAEPLIGQNAPVDAGLYIATAAYTDAEGNVHTDAAVIVIAPKASEIKVSADVIKEDGAAHKPTVTATKGAAYTLISAEADLGAKTVMVNIDMPAKAKALLDKVLAKIGYTMPEDVTLQQLVDELAIVTNATDKIESLIPMETLTELGVPTAKVESVLNKVDTYVETLYTQLTDLMAKVGADVVVTFEHNKTYSKPGVYYFMGIVTDPDFMPSANAGYLVIENAQFAAEDKIITEKEAGDGYELKPTDNAGRGYLTMIKTAEGLNLLIDGNEEQAVIDKIEKKFNITLDGGKVTIDQLVAKGDDWAEKMAEVITDTIRERATAKINGHELIVKVRDIALDIMEKGLDKVEAKIAAKIKSIAAPYGNKTIAINGALPKDIGKYEFHFLSYAVAYETAELEIVDDLFRLAGANVLLGDTLDMFYYVKTADLRGTDYYAVVTRTYADGKADDVRTIPYDEWEIYDTKGTLIRFGYDKLAAKEMTDEMYVTVYHGDGTPASYEWVDSIQMYSQRQLKPTACTELKRVIVDMLNYGTEAQHEFGYNEEDLANAIVGEYAEFASGDVDHADSRIQGENYVGTSVVTKSRLILTFYFENITRDTTAYISYTDHYGNAETLEVPGSEYYARGNLLGVDVTGMAVADGRCLVTCEVKDGDTVVASASDSIESYAHRNQSVVTAYKLLQFADSADAYFESIKK